MTVSGIYEEHTEEHTDEHTDDYNNTDKPDDEDDYDNEPEHEEPAEGECSKEAMKDWRHAMEKWKKSYKGIFIFETGEITANKTGKK